MATVFIANLAIVLPSRFAAGDTLSANAAEVLNDIQIKRVKSKLRWLHGRGEIALAELQAKAIEFNLLEMQVYGTTDDEDETEDPVYTEALSMARDLIVQRMAQQGLPPPKGLDEHAKALVKGLPELQERARLRIEARYKAASAVIQESA